MNILFSALVILACLISVFAATGHLYPINQ